MKKRITSIATVLIFFCMLSAPMGVARAAELQAATMMEAMDKVNVRDLPDMEADVLGQLEPGEKLFAVKLSEDGWYRVVYQGEEGYVKSDFLKVCGAEEWDAPQDEEFPVGEIVDPEEEVKKASEEAARKESEAIEQSAAIEASKAAAAEARKQVALEQKKRSNRITLGIFVGAVLLIVGYGAFTVVKEMKNPEEEPRD